MELNEGVLRKFVGGQIEVQNRDEGYLFRGEIKATHVEDKDDDTSLVVELEWMAQAEGYPPGPGRWVKSDAKPYKVSLMIYHVSDIGDNRICLQSSIVGEMTILYPKGGSVLDRSKVVGL